MLNLTQIHIDKLKLEKHCNRKLLKYLDENLNIECIDLFPRHILIAELWQKDKQYNYDAIKILIKSDTIKTYLQNKFKNIKKINAVGILSGIQTFDSKTNHYDNFIKSIKLNDLKQFRFLLTQQNTNPNNNEALCYALIGQDKAYNESLKYISNEMVNLLLNDPKTTSKGSIISVLTNSPNINYTIKSSILIQNACSKLILTHTKEDINLIISNVVDSILTHKIYDLLFSVCNNPKINLEQFVDNLIKIPKISISSVVYYCIKYNDVNLIDIILKKTQIKIDVWCKIIGNILIFDNICLVDFIDRYPFFSTTDITLYFVKDRYLNTTRSWLTKMSINYTDILQDNINTGNLENIELLLNHSMYYETFDISHFITPTINENLLNSIFTIAITLDYIKLIDFILINTNINPFKDGFNCVKILKSRRRKCNKLAEYFWVKIILTLDIFLIKDIRHIVFVLLKILNHDIFAIM